jgi:peptide/nickel transport system substrate-binding protein
VFGLLNMHKAGSPWRDVRLRQAVNVAVNREDLIRYATKGNGSIVPAMVPVHSFGYDPGLAPYPFDPAHARQLVVHPFNLLTQGTCCGAFPVLQFG